MKNMTTHRNTPPSHKTNLRSFAKRAISNQDEHEAKRILALITNTDENKNYIIKQLKVIKDLIGKAYQKYNIVSGKAGFGKNDYSSGDELTNDLLHFEVGKKLKYLCNDVHTMIGLVMNDEYYKNRK